MSFTRLNYLNMLDNKYPLDQDSHIDKVHMLLKGYLSIQFFRDVVYF